MVLLKLLILTLTSYYLIAHLEAVLCPKGQKVTNNRGCEPCTSGYFQPEENPSKRCKVCTKCGEGSSTKEECSKVTNTKCQCRENFVPSEEDSSTCRCEKGFGKQNGVCSKCEEGFFSSRSNVPCQKWRECKSAGVKSNGTRTSDVICNEERKPNTFHTSPTTSNNVVSLFTHLTSPRPHEGARTQIMFTNSKSGPGVMETPPHREQPLQDSSHMGTRTVLVLLILGTFGMIVLTTLTCKLIVYPYWVKKQGVKPQDSLCRSPVEESGDDSLSSLKLNPGEQGEIC